MFETLFNISTFDLTKSIIPTELKVLPLPKTDSGINNQIVRVPNTWIDRKKLDRTKLFRREPVIVTYQSTGASVLRYVMGVADGQMQIRMGTNSIALDYDAIDSLGLPFFTSDPARITIRRATEFEKYRYFWNHQDLGIQLSIRLGLAGAALGVMGFIVGLLSFL